MADNLERFACYSARLSCWLAIKALAWFAWPPVRFAIIHTFPLLRELAYLFDLHWNGSPAGIVFIVLMMYFNIRGPPLSTPSIPWSALRERYYLCFAYMYQLPSASRVIRPGFSWAYATLLNLSLVTFAFPHMHPLVYLLDHVVTYQHIGQQQRGVHFIANLNHTHNELSPGSQTVYYSQHIGYSTVRWSAMLLNCCLLFLAIYFGTWSARRRDYTPIHDLEAHNTLACTDDCQHEPTPASPTPSPTTSTPDFEPYQEQTTEPASELHPPEDVFETNSPEVPIAAPVPPPAPLVVPPIVNAADPLRLYDLPPRVISGFDNWRNLMLRTPNPPNILDVNNMCVWDVLSSHLGVPATRVWACYSASLPMADRVWLQVGLVPPEELSRIMTFFACTFTIRGSTNVGDCPRAPGTNAPQAAFDPQTPPYMEGTGLDGWPSFTCYITNNGDGSFHFTNTAVAQRNAPGFAPPNPVSPIGWLSRLVPGVEIGEVVNLPAKGFATVYRRLLGNMGNPLSRYLPAPRLANYILPLVPVTGQVVQYVPNAIDAGYARGLASDLKAKPATLDLNEFGNVESSRTLDQMAKQYYNFCTTGRGIQYAPVKFHLYHGVGGGGKSYTMIQDLVQAHRNTPFTPANLTFHTWNHKLRASFMSDVLTAMPNLGLQPGNFTTGCMPLVRPCFGTAVFDDAGLLWSSYLPLFMAANPGVTDIWVTFDAAQGVGVIPAAGSISIDHPMTKDWLSPMSDNYGTGVIRLSQEVCDLYGFPRVVIPGRIAPAGSVTCVSQSPHGVPLFAVSPRFTQTQNMGGQAAYTFQEVQGHTVHGDVCVDLGGLTATCTDNAAWTALTRATASTFLKLGPMMQTTAVIETSWAKSQILTAMLTVATIRQTPYLTAAMDVDGLIRSAVYSHLAKSLSPGACAALGMPAASPTIGTKGVSKVYRSSWLNSKAPANDVYTARTHKAVFGHGGGQGGAAFSRHSAQITNHTTSPVANIVRHFTDLDPEATLHSDSTGYALPDPQPILSQPDPVDDINDPMDDVLRETCLPDNEVFLTSQHIFDGAPDALHHHRGDTVTDILGQRKRIRVGKHNAPWSAADARRLKQLKRGFSKFFDVAKWQSEATDLGLMELCERDKLASWSSKRTKRVLQASIDKQDVDLPYTFTRLFPKGQFIKKKAKWRCNAFASQTVSDFHLGRIFRDAPRALFLERKSIQYAYSSTYLHYKASPDDMSRWYRRHWRVGKMTGNDYTAWDSGIDHVFLEFDLWLMELCHFPPEYVSRFKFERLNTHSFLGNHMPRQESGDRWTWILNTLRNAALTGASLDCPPHTPLCVSGDDSVTLGAWRKSDGFFPGEWLMVPKREEGTTMEFCGLIFGGTDVSFDPSVIHWRARFGLQQGRADPDYWLSIRQAIIECRSKLGGESTKLAGALHNLRRAIQWFGLDPKLDIPDPPPPAAQPFDTFLTSLSKWLRWSCFLL